jgi:hypothetical protein
MTASADRIFAAKRAWHAAQRALSPKEKVRIMIALQRRELELNGFRAALGRPRHDMRVWDTRP